jgi:hypothetical protein
MKTHIKAKSPAARDCETLYLYSDNETTVASWLDTVNLPNWIYYPILFSICFCIFAVLESALFQLFTR